MDVHIQMEITARELEGRSLLALAAAERGHHVLLGDVEEYLAGTPRTFAPGIFHDKALTPGRRRTRLYADLLAHGHTITSQDEEHFLALPSFDVPARTRFSTTTLEQARRSFAWGDHEADALRAHYPGLGDRIVTTGSPRADLWRPELRSVHGREPLPVPDDRPVILVSSNFSAVLDVNPLWVRLRDKRERYVGADDPVEFDYYTFTAEKLHVLRAFVRGVRRLARRHPEAVVVVRPHPIEQDGAWEDLVGPDHGVVVTRAGTLTAWIHRAAVVIQNGCTSGYEAALLDTPTIALHPDGVFADHPSNAFSQRAATDDELDALVARALRGDVAGWRDPAGDAVLARRLAALDGPLAADRIVAEWEALDVPAGRPLAPTPVLRAARRAVRARHRAARLKGRLTAGDTGARGGAFRVAHKFPPLRETEVAGLVDALRRATGRFGGVAVEVVAPDLVAFRPARSGSVGRPAARPRP